ncbi:MAG: ABC transporter ATP-binding protein [Nannocystaceae bacterium]
MTALALTGVRKRYADRPVLDGVDLEIARGEVVALIGPNGAGKSTLLGCVAGTVIADAGTVAIAGHDLASAPLRARAALRYLPQEIDLPAGVTGRELLELHGAIFAAPVSDAALALADLGEALDFLATTYSVGMRRRTLLAALSLGEAALWVVDEPFAGLDKASHAAALRLLRERAAAGAGILVAAHDAEDPSLRELDARPLLLSDGRLRAL